MIIGAGAWSSYADCLDYVFTVKTTKMVILKSKCVKLTAFVLPLSVPLIFFLSVFEAVHNTESFSIEIRVSRSHWVDRILDSVGRQSSIFESLHPYPKI